MAIGLTLTLVHLIGIPITNVSVNPARSTGPALFVGGWALHQLWLFWLAPIAGAAIAGGLARYLQVGAAEAHARARRADARHDHAGRADADAVALVDEKLTLGGPAQKAKPVCKRIVRLPTTLLSTAGVSAVAGMPA